MIVSADRDSRETRVRWMPKVAQKNRVKTMDDASTKEKIMNACAPLDSKAKIVRMMSDLAPSENHAATMASANTEEQISIANASQDSLDVIARTMSDLARKEILVRMKENVNMTERVLLATALQASQAKHV